MNRKRSDTRSRGTTRRPARAATETAPALELTRLNWALLGAAAVLVLTGFLALGSGSPALSTTVAPLLLVVGYVALFPIGLIR